MNYWRILMLLLFCKFINGLTMANNLHKEPQKNLALSNLILSKKENINIIMKRKTQGFIKIIRPQNIIPTLFLSFTGGWISNPSIKSLLNCPKFIVSSINAVSVMSISMIINDLFDLELDKINNPKRPLVTGEITKAEAIIYNCILIGLTELLSFKYLATKSIIFVNLALLNVIIYTPFLKRLLFIKNVSCASLVSFSIFFSGLASISLQNTFLDNKSRSLLWIAVRTIFFGSLFNELLLDMHDYEGDKKFNINTFPVVFGLEKSWVLANIIMKTNIAWNSFHIMYLYNFQIGIIFSFILYPLLFDLRRIKISGFSKESISKSISNSNVPLFLLLIYLCILVKL
jgi:geranylgeranylglycerol-phosphate geranylgeranyltransferase